MLGKADLCVVPPRRERRRLGQNVDRRRQIWLDLAMERVKVAELRDQLSRHLRAVEAGAEVEVTDRNRPIARIVPLDRSAIPSLRPPSRPFSTIRRRRYAPAGWQVSSTDLMLEDRRRR